MDMELLEKWGSDGRPYFFLLTAETLLQKIDISSLFSTKTSLFF